VTQRLGRFRKGKSRVRTSRAREMKRGPESGETGRRDIMNEGENLPASRPDCKEINRNRQKNQQTKELKARQTKKIDNYQTDRIGSREIKTK